jgi:hypothetical protein
MRLPRFVPFMIESTHHRVPLGGTSTLFFSVIDTLSEKVRNPPLVTNFRSTHGSPQGTLIGFYFAGIDLCNCRGSKSGAADAW